MLVRVAAKVVLYSSLLLATVHVHAQHLPGVKMTEPSRWLGISLSAHELEKASKPIGNLLGQWHGEWDGYDVELNHDANPSTLTLTQKSEDRSVSEQRVVVTAEYSRKGRLLTLSEVSCLKQVSQRQWVLTRQNCPILDEGQVFGLTRNKDQRWLLLTGKTQISLSKD
jgi:hypothetical protein